MKARIAIGMTLSLLVQAGICAGYAAESPAWVGYGGPEGSRVYRHVSPPTTFGADDIAWKTEIPDLGWGHGSPIVVPASSGNSAGASGLVIIGAEYDERHNAFPSLLAFNTSDGGVAWKALLDHTPSLPNGEKLRELWLKVIADNVKRWELNRAYQESGKSEEKKKEIEALGYTIHHKFDSVVGGQALTKGEWDVLHRAAFGFETWRGGLVGKINWCVGHMYATPVSDGKRIYACTAFGGFFAFDLDGKQLWCTASPGQQGEYCRNGRSPILWKDPASGKVLLISDITNKVRAFDAATGELLWTDDGPGDFKYDDKQGGGVHTVITPAVMRVGPSTSSGQATEILVAAGLNCYRLPDGKKLQVEGWNVQDYGMQSLVKHDERDVLFLCGVSEHCGWRGRGGMSDPRPDHYAPAALRFTLAGDTLTAKVLWEGRDLAENWYPRVGGGNSPWMLYHEDKFYHLGGAIFDALTGKRMAGEIYSKGRNQAVPETGHLLCVAGDHVYGFGPQDRTGKALMSVYTLDGKKVADNLLPDEAKSYGWGFTFDQNSIYVRGLRHLIKIGRNLSAHAGANQ